MDIQEFVSGCRSCDPHIEPDRADELLKVAAELGEAILKNREKAVSVSDDNSDFNRFWQAYPKKVAKAAAQRAWKKLKPSKKLQSIIFEALEQQKKLPQWQKDHGQYIPNPATWLNGRRWEDVQEQTVHSEYDPNNPYKDWR